MILMEWISVKDKLPTKNDKDVVCLINGYPMLGIVTDANLFLGNEQIYFYWPNGKWLKNNYYAEITHWMPLPKPPKEKS